MTALAVLDRGALRIHRPEMGSVHTVAPATAANRQPAWSPDGRWLAWCRFDRRSPDAPSKIVIADSCGKSLNEHDTVFPAFYLHWRPDSKSIAALAEGPLGLELTVVDVSTGSSSILSRGGPLFFDWHDDGSLLANIGAGAASRFELHGVGEGSELGHEPGVFNAPARLPGTQSFVVAVKGVTANELVIVDGNGMVIRSLRRFAGEIRFVVAPDGKRLAWVVRRPRDGDEAPDDNRLCVQELTANETTIVTETAPLTFEWSPDSTKLLYLAPDDIGGTRWMRWHVWSSRGDCALDWCRPSATEVRDYLPFAEQHARGQRRWAPDSGAFCYAGAATSGQEGVWIQPLDTAEADYLCAGQLAWWSPAPT